MHPPLQKLRLFRRVSGLGGSQRNHIAHTTDISTNATMQPTRGLHVGFIFVTETLDRLNVF